MTKFYKFLTIVIALFTVLGHVGSYLYVPREIEKIKSEVEKLKEYSRSDHDTLIEVKADVKNINKKLDSKGIVYNYESTVTPVSYGKPIYHTNWLRQN